MADGKDGKKKIKRSEDRRGNGVGEGRRDALKKNVSVEKSRRKGRRRTGKDRRS